MDGDSVAADTGRLKSVLHGIPEEELKPDAVLLQRWQINQKWPDERESIRRIGRCQGELIDPVNQDEDRVESTRAYDATEAVE